MLVRRTSVAEHDAGLPMILHGSHARSGAVSAGGVSMSLPQKKLCAHLLNHVTPCLSRGRRMSAIL